MGRLGHGIAMGALAAAIVVMASPAMAQDQVQFQVAAGPLDRVLTDIATQAGRRIAFEPALVRGMSSPGVTGTMSATDAVGRVLGGTNLVLQVSGEGEWFVVARPQTADAPDPEGKMLATVRVRADAQSLATVGDNGSSDPIATEGTGSYTAKAAAIASKTPLALKDTPQSVSVVTRQQIDDRQLTSITDTLNATPGVTVLDSAIYSRGFEINNVQIDGGSPLSFGKTQNFSSSYKLTDDMSIYDSVSVLRGAAGAFTGTGGAGGVISLERKRPTDHPQLQVELAAGSWDRYRAVVDASSPFFFHDLLRARVVLTHEQQNYFYHPASSKLDQAYVNFEIDPSGSTAINFGGKYVYSRSSRWNGIPTLTNGKQADLSRDTCICTPWARVKSTGPEYFVQLTQQLGNDWKIRVNTSANLQKNDSLYFNAGVTSGYTGIDPAKPRSQYAYATISPTKSDQYLADVFLAGKFSMFGVDTELTAGGNVQAISQKVTGGTYTYKYTTSDILNFDPDDYPEPTASQYTTSNYFIPRYHQLQYGGYVNLRFTAWDRVHLTISERYSHYTTEQTSSTNGKLNYVKVESDNLPMPNFGLVFDVTKTLSVYGTYQSIFDQGNYLTANGGLIEPMTGMNFEGGVKKAFMDGKLNVAIAGFYIKRNNIPVQDQSVSYYKETDTSATCCYYTDGTRQTSKGGEITLQGALTNRLNADLSYTYKVEDYVPGTSGETTRNSRYSPDHLAKAWVYWRPPVLDDKLSLGIGGHAQSSVNAIRSAASYNSATQTFYYNYFYTYGRPYATIDGSVQYRLNEKFSAQLNLTNILDKTYYRQVNYYTGNYYGTPQSFLLTLRGKI
jgi:outer-membrane receptor for ferric coprogen and ferric-rhodotorulic acid